MQKWVNFEVIVEANLEVTVAVMEDLRTWKAPTGPGRLVESKFKKTFDKPISPSFGASFIGIYLFDQS